MKKLLLFLFLLPLACSTSQNKKEAPPPAKPVVDPNWSTNMRSLMEVLTELLPVVHRKADFDKPENRALIETATQRLSKLSHSMNSKSIPPETDPSIRFMSQLFEQEIKRTKESLEFGQLEYARLSLRNITGYCIACHTRHGESTKLPAQIFNSRVSSLTAAEKAEYYAATRQFDLAASQYKSLLGSSRSELKPLEWEQAARQALALEVRVHRDPQGAIQIVDKILQSQRAPTTFKAEATEWKQALQNWLSESTDRRTRFLKMTPKRELETAEELIQQAQKRQRYPMDRAGDMEYLRASDLLHTALSMNLLKPKEEAQALYLAGISSEALRDLSFWTMHETLYELCIDRAPGTTLANKCFDRLESSIKSSYSGSSGINIPGEVQEHLMELKTKAKTPPPKSSKAKKRRHK